MLQLLQQELPSNDIHVVTPNLKPRQHFVMWDLYFAGQRNLDVYIAVLEWVRTRESGSESESTRSESESESIRPESESIRCESESIGPESESESESIRPESESESESSGSESESESVSTTEVRVSPDLSPDSAWTHESNNRKVLYFNPSFNHFCWALYW